MKSIFKAILFTLIICACSVPDVEVQSNETEEIINSLGRISRIDLHTILFFKHLFSAYMNILNRLVDHRLKE